MVEKVLYIGCNERGEETLEGEIMGNKLACEHSKFRENIKKESNCKICSADSEYGIYVFNIDNNNLKDYEYSCYNCCKEKNMFKKYNGGVEKFSYSKDVGFK